MYPEADSLKDMCLVYGGVLEWYNMNASSLRAAGHGFGVEGTRAHGHRYARCVDTFDRTRCVGPFAFAKGPWMLLSRDVANQIVQSPAFKSSKIVVARNRRPKYRVHDDALLGMWASTVADISYIRIPRKTVWLDRTPPILRTGHVLAAHKPRHACWIRSIADDENIGLTRSFCA